jgi:hypothetical protein
MTAAWDLMTLASHGVPVPRGDLRKAIRRAWPLLEEALNDGDPDDPTEMGVAGFRCTVVFGALARLWSVEPHEVQELWTAGLLDCALQDEFRVRRRTQVEPA